MKIVKGLLVAVVVLATLLYGGGLLLSPHFTVVRSATLAAPPERLFPLVAAPRRWKDWGEWSRRDPGMQVSYSGPEQGPGAVWSWTSRSEGDGRMTITAAEPPRRVAFELYFPDFGTTSRGEILFAPEGAGTRVTWTMNGEMGGSPVARWMGLLMDRLVGKDFEAGLANLGRLAAAP